VAPLHEELVHLRCCLRQPSYGDQARVFSHAARSFFENLNSGLSASVKKMDPEVKRKLIAELRGEGCLGSREAVSPCG